MVTKKLHPGSVPSLPEVFPGQNERVEGIEGSASGPVHALVEPITEPTFLDSGRIVLEVEDVPQTGSEKS